MMVGQALGWAPSLDDVGDGGGRGIVDDTGDGDGGWWVSDDAGDGGGRIAVNWGWSLWLSLGMGVVMSSPSTLGMVVIIVIGQRWRWWQGIIVVVGVGGHIDDVDGGVIAVVWWLSTLVVGVAGE